MEDIRRWESKFEPCVYSNNLLDKLVLLNKKAKQPIDISEVKKAIYYAKKYHAEQKRQSGEPYYSHPIEVAILAAYYSAQEYSEFFRTDIIVTSILHDTIEDTALSKQMIEEIFGCIVANQVVDLTRITIDKKISPAAALNILFSQNKKDVLYIKLLDRLHNLKTIGAKSTEKQKKIINETLLYFLPFAVYLEMRSIEEELINVCHQKLNKFKAPHKEGTINLMQECFLLNSQEIQNILHSNKKIPQLES